jgi:hypothetical protein
VVARVVLLVLLAGLSGCASLAPVTVGRSGMADDRMALAAGPAQTTGGGRVQTRGLPLTRGQKIALWTGVAALTGYLIADSDDNDEFAFGAP